MYQIKEDILEFKDPNYFYHISLKRVKREFKPRIPDSRAKQENESIKRICVASSVKHCLSAMPSSNYFKTKLEGKQYLGIPFLIYIYKIKKDLIKNENIINPEVLYKDNLVADALVTQEHWIINQNIIFEEPIVIQIKDIKQGDLFIPGFGNFIFVTKEYKHENLQQSSARTSIFTFTNKSDLNKIKKLIHNIGYVIEEKLLSNKKFLSLKFFIKEEQDCSTLWEKYYKIRMRYGPQLVASDYDILNESV